MSRLSPTAPITAVIYQDRRPPDTLLAAVASRLGAAGVSLAGFVEKDMPRPGRTRCDMILEDLATGDQVQISEDRGEGARGCRLQVGELLRAMTSALAGLDLRPDLLIVNKFGKTESEGGGFRPLIAAALERAIPILIAVPARNLDSWRRFAGELAVEYRHDEVASVETLCGLLGVPSSAATGSRRSLQSAATAAAENSHRDRGIPAGTAEALPLQSRAPEAT